MEENIKMNKIEIDVWAILQDISAISMWVVLPLYVLVQIVKGLNYFEPQSVEWWMVIGLLLVMLKSNVMGLRDLDRLKKYLEPIISRFVVLKNQTTKR